MGERRSCNLQPLLALADRQPLMSGPDKETVERKPRRIAEGFELSSGVLYRDHEGSFGVRVASSQFVFLEI